MKQKIELIAEACHEMNRIYCQMIGDNSINKWDEAPNWQKASSINGVEFHLNNNVSPRESHENWLRVKREEGWKYGEVKNPDKKEHPCFVPYDELPEEQKKKDLIFKTIIDLLK